MTAPNPDTVVCPTCLNAGTPVEFEDGLRLPVHHRRRETFPFGTMVCTGSLRAVTR